MADLTCLIIMTTFERPNMAKGAIESVRDQISPDWKLVVIDDNFPESPPFEPIAREILKDHLDKVTFYKIGDTLEKRREQNGTRHPEYMNKGILENDLPGETPIINLCDDDQLLPDTVLNISNYFKNNPDKMWGYGHLVPYNPFTEKPNLEMKSRGFGYNYLEPLWPFNRVDGSQVTVRKQAFIDGIRYPSPAHRCLDAALFERMQQKYPPCEFMGFQSQYKGWDYGNQLGSRNSGNEYSPLDLP